jgi:Fe-S-cluster containining protein
VDRILDRDTGELLELTPGALCKRCASVGYTCCQPAYGVSITLHDAAKILRSTDHKLADFCVINPIEDDELLEGLKIDPQFRQLFIGKRRLLQHVQRGKEGLDCYFLGKNGCTIFEHRPRLCHFHPFWFEVKKGAKVSVSYDSIEDREDADNADCLVVNKLWPNLELGLQSVGETPESFGTHARAMNEEIAWHAKQIKKLLTNVRPKDLTLEMLEPIIKKAPQFKV